MILCACNRMLQIACEWVCSIRENYRVPCLKTIIVLLLPVHLLKIKEIFALLEIKRQDGDYYQSV
jgi:hypothetical protein